MDFQSQLLHGKSDYFLTTQYSKSQVESQLAELRLQIQMPQRDLQAEAEAMEADTGENSPTVTDDFLKDMRLQTLDEKF
jgi:hypothetical protein